MTLELNFPNPVLSGRDLFDRDAELREAHAVLAQSSPRIVVFLGERKIGKTSTLNVFIEREQSHVLPLHLPTVYSLTDFWAEILEGLCGAADISMQALGLMDERGYVFPLDEQQVLQIIADLLARTSRPVVVLCLDEFDSFLTKCDADERDAVLEFVCRSVEADEWPVRWVFTMTRVEESLPARFRDRFQRLSHQVRLAPWEEESARAFVEWLLGDYLTFSDAAHEELYVAAGGHPYFTKAVLHTLINELGKGQGAHILPEDVHLAVEVTLRLPNVAWTLRNLAHAHLSGREQAVLTESVSGHPVQDTDVAERLVQRGYLIHQGEGHYALRLGLLGMWLFRHAPEAWGG